MSATTFKIDKYDEESDEIISYKKRGDLVVCNLSSLVIDRIKEYANDNAFNFYDLLNDVIKIQVRMGDNVISKGKVPVKAAQITNHKYRSLGLGEMGRSAYLANESIAWDSDEAIKHIAQLEEYIMLQTIIASANIGEEKGSYPLFEGSEWNTGEWLEKRKDDSVHKELFEIALERSKKHMRNGYVRAIAPNASSSLNANSTPSTDTIYDIIYKDSKYSGHVIAKNLNRKTFGYYKPTMRFKPIAEDGSNQLNHIHTIKLNQVTQKWVDQAISSNIYIPVAIKPKNLLKLHFAYWEMGLKTSYYVNAWTKQAETACLSCE